MLQFYYAGIAPNYTTLFGTPCGLSSTQGIDKVGVNLQITWRQNNWWVSFEKGCYREKFYLTSAMTASKVTLVSLACRALTREGKARLLEWSDLRDIMSPKTWKKDYGRSTYRTTVSLENGLQNKVEYPDPTGVFHTQPSTSGVRSVS